MDKRIELILQQLQQLPTLPVVAMRVLEATGDDDSSAKQVVELISSDPALTAKILKLVHAADAGVRGEVTTVDRAVVLLGFEAVRAAALAVSVFQVFAIERPAPGQPAASAFDRQAFWKHSIAVGCCAEAMAGMLLASAPAHLRAELPAPSQAFVCGLLHDIGKVALDAVLPKSFGRVVEAADLIRGNIADIERSVIGLDHMVVGKRLCEQWKLPPAIRDCVWLHGQLPAALPASVRHPKLVNLITLADLVVRNQHIGYSGNHTFAAPREALQEAVGIDDAAMKRVQHELIDLVEPRAKGLGLDDSETSELYLAALEQANRELGRIGEQLAGRNRKLAARAKFFDALASFQGDLRPDAPPGAVIEAIAQTAVGALQASPVAVFSLLSNAQLAEVVIAEEGGDITATSVVDAPTQVARPSTGDGPVLSAGERLEWLMADISPRLSGDHRYWICLEAEGACIGGVVWGGVGQEAQRLSTQAQELSALAGGWSLALRTAQIREESRTLTEQLAEANRQLHSVQSELLRSRTLVSMGEMAAGAAHEMNNPLAVISGRAQLLASQLSDPRMKHAAQAIFEQSHRLSQIITDLMGFAKPEPARPETTDLAELVARAVHDAKALSDPADRTIEVTMGEVPQISADPRQMCDALVEVIDNAIRATDEKTGAVAIHAAYDSYSSRVVLSVTDNGCGMDEQTLKRAFDPFFSSKPAGRRRGLGLAKALRWVEAAGGTIRLESRPGAGTRAMILFPAAMQIDASHAEAGTELVTRHGAG